MTKPTPKAKKTRYEVLRVVREYFRENGVIPTIRHIAKELNIRSTNTVHYHLRKLETEDDFINMKKSRVVMNSFCSSPKITKKKKELDSRVVMVEKMVKAKDAGDMATYSHYKQLLAATSKARQ